VELGRLPREWRQWHPRDPEGVEVPEEGHGPLDFGEPLADPLCDTGGIGDGLPSVRFGLGGVVAHRLLALKTGRPGGAPGRASARTPARPFTG
jgi:hypothetical protein